MVVNIYISLPLLVGEGWEEEYVRYVAGIVRSTSEIISYGLEICLWERDDRDKKGNCLVAREYLRRFLFT